MSRLAALTRKTSNNLARAEDPNRAMAHRGRIGER